MLEASVSVDFIIVIDITISLRVTATLENTQKYNTVFFINAFKIIPKPLQCAMEKDGLGHPLTFNYPTLHETFVNTRDQKKNFKLLKYSILCSQFVWFIGTLHFYSHFC